MFNSGVRLSRNLFRLGTIATVSALELGKVTMEKVKEKSASEKRDQFLCWDDYFMSVAFLSAQRSKDPVTQVGACIVNSEKRIVGIGYNGMPSGCDDNELPWGKTSEDWLETKYPYVCHAEMNAVLNKNCSSIRGCSIYVALFPCNDCAKVIIQSGIKKVYYYSDKYHDRPSMKASRTLLKKAGVEFVQYVPKEKQILIDFDRIEKL